MRQFSILTYHSLDDSGSLVSVAPRCFADQMAALKRLGYRGITLREALAQRQEHGTWPKRSIAITFDDGYDSVREHALPVLREHGFRATLYVVSGHVGGTNDWSTTPAKLGQRPVMTWEQLRECAVAGMEIGGHTMTHPDLSTLDARRIEDELSGCKCAIESQLDAPCDNFAYPYGRLDGTVRDVTERTYGSACTTVLRRACGESLGVLPRIDMYYVQTPALFEHLVRGELDRYLMLRRWGRAVRGAFREGHTSQRPNVPR